MSQRVLDMLVRILTAASDADRARYGYAEAARNSTTVADAERYMRALRAESMEDKL